MSKKVDFIKISDLRGGRGLTALMPAGKPILIIQAVNSLKASVPIDKLNPEGD